MKSINKFKLIYQVLAFTVPFAVYLFTLAPSVWFIDSGELANAAVNLAIAHPTGYPLFTVIGNIFSKLPFGTPIFNLNLMCAVISSVTILIFFNLLLFIVYNLNLNEGVQTSLKNFHHRVFYNIALGSSFILAFSKTFWDSATYIEVYSLHSFFLVLILYLFLKAIGVKNKDKTASNNNWILFSFILGLGFTNHLTVIFLSLGFIYLYFSLYGYNEHSLKNILKSAVPFLLGYSFYVYLIVRTGNDVISWGEPDTFSNFYKHIFGKQFANLMFGSFDVATAQFFFFLENYPIEFFIFPLILIIPGLLELKNFSRRLYIFTLLLFFFNLLYAINYNVVDIENYFLLLIIVSVIWMYFGLIFLIKRFKEKSLTISFVSLLIFIIPLSQNFGINNKSGDYTIRDFIKNFYKSVPENSIVFAVQWNVVISPSLYFNFVEDIRPDIILINKEQLSEGWYIEFLRKHHPELYEKSSEAFELYKTELVKFESNPGKYKNPESDVDNQEIVKFQTAFKKLVDDIVNKNYNDKNIYISYETEEDKSGRIAQNYPRIPQGLLFRLSNDTASFDNYVMPEFNFIPSAKTDFNNMYITKSYMQAYMGRANYLMKFQKYDEAESLLKNVVKYYPNIPEVLQLQKKLNILKKDKNTQ